MPPKKKNNKKADDWEAELEDPVAAVKAPEPTSDAPAEADAEDEFPAGGLMAMMRKKQKNKKGKQKEDVVEGGDPSAEAQPGLEEKAPVEASIDEEFAVPEKKGKGKSAPVKPAKEDDEDEEERGADGKIMTKAQKEKAKKEREKQRKKENVRWPTCLCIWEIANIDLIGCEKEDNSASCESRGSGKNYG